MSAATACANCGTTFGEILASANGGGPLCRSCYVATAPEPEGELSDGAEPASAVSAVPRLSVRTADLGLVRPTRWAWAGRMPLGYLSLLLGAEGAGKGTLWPWILAAATRGELPGDLHGEPARVLVVGDEDSFESVTVPRCHAAGADIGLLDSLEDGGELDIARDAADLAGVIRTGGYKLVILDALLDVIGAEVDDWRSKSVRTAIRPLRRIARELEIAVLGSLHPNKGSRGSFRDLVSGSHAFNAQSRSSLWLAEHPDDPERRVLVRGKGNLSAPPPSFEFRIESRELEINGHTFHLPVVTDQGDGDTTVEDVLKPERAAPVRENLAEQIDKLGTGEIQTRSDLARAIGREPNDRSVDRALSDLEDQGRWEKVARGKWQCLRIGIGVSKDTPMSTNPKSGDVGEGV